MSTEMETAAAAPPPGWRRWISGRRRGWWLAGIVILAGLALGWDWLAAIGALPVLLALLPCAAMCALGLCMNHKNGRSCDQSNTGTTEKPI